MATSGNDVLNDTTAANAFDGGAGSDTVSYAAATRAVLADLAAGTAYKLVRIMPLGASITKGVTATYIASGEGGGYRLKLWTALQAQNVTVDFVGSLANGPTTFDRQHEGHSGWSLNDLNAQDGTWLATSKPDYVLLLAGTNDARMGDSSATMINDMRSLITSITNNSPSAKVLVSTLPPVRTDAQPLVVAQRIAGFNAALPGLVAELVGQGRKAAFVDMRDLTTADITPPPTDNGLHPTNAGYQKIANHWKTALVAQAGLVTGGIGTDKDRLVSIENLTGSANADSLKGNDVANVLSGGAGDDRLDGRNGDDRLVGGVGRDTITGGGGDDAFRFAAGDGHDTITDFVAGGTSDRIEVAGYSRVAEKRQVGADTLVVLSANDDLLLKNVSAGALTAADFTFNGVAPPPPPGGGTTGTAGHDTLVGTAGADVLHGLAGNDSMEGLGGSDFKRGGSGSDTYRFRRGGAVDTVDNDSSDHVTSVDSLVFASDVSRSQLWFKRSGDDLVASVIGTNDRAVLIDWYSEWWARVDKFRAGDGKTLASGDVRQLVDAMASLSPPALGQTSLTAGQHAALDPVIAAVWR